MTQSDYSAYFQRDLASQKKMVYQTVKLRVKGLKTDEVASVFCIKCYSES